MPTIPPSLDRLLRPLHVDFEPAGTQPAPVALAAATAVAVVGSLAADAILVAIGKVVFPATKGYQHYQFGDYATLTVIGVIVACVGWPVVTRMTSEPRWVFTRLAVIVSAVLLLPDVALLVRGDPAQAVLVLVVMHIAIGVVTYLGLTRVAPVRAARRRMATVGD